MSNTSNNKTANSKPTKSKDKDKLRVIVGEIGRDSKTGILGRGYSSDNGKTFHVTDTMYGRLYDPNDIEGIWNGGTADKVKKEVDSATAEIPAAVSAANSAVSAAESAVAASKVNSDAIVAQSEAISEAKSAMDSATAEIQQTAANAASDAAKIRADVAQVQSEVDTAKAANAASVEALKSDVSAAKQDLADVHDSLTKAQSAIEQNQKLINDSVAKITSDVSATKQDLATVHDSLTKAQAAAEQNQKAINDSIAEINANVDATNQDLAGVRKDLTKAQSDITANQKAIDDNVDQISDDITQDRKDIADVRQGLTKAQSDITANQKAVNDNVAQINSDIEQDRKDIASAQQANADTVKQLDAYSKQAQEQGKTIKAVQDKQDGFSATLADVQGNVSQVSDKVSGLSASLKDAQDNVASVKAQADQLSATLTDHSKSIAILTASAKELSSTLEDADGRLSKVEQTAQTNSSTLSDVQGDLSQVKQNATKLVSTLKDAQGNISTLQQKADSLSTQLASAQGDIATLQTGIDGVKAILTSHDKSIHTLQADSKSLKDSMVNAQGDISTLRKTATDVTSELEDHTGRLSKVEQSAAKQATTLSDLQGNLSQVEQKADSNTATISSINKNAMQDRGVITDTKTSFDSLTQLGTYSIKASGLPKMPEQHYGTLVVSGSAGSGWLSQQFVADTTGNVYTRVFSNNAWSAWKQGGSQDAINQVKQTADSNSATIRNVQGDVSTLKQTATGIKSTLASHEGDIHTLQADSKSLKDSMTNAQGDISTLQKSATSLDSEMKDHAGRLSKVEQNAATQATTLSDLQGNLSQVKQQADGLVTTLKDAQGSITQIQQKADGMLEQLKSAQGDIASLQTDVTGIKATLTSHEGDIHTLQADSKTLKDDMQDAQGNISSLQKSSTKLDSEMSSQDGRLSKVEQTAKEHTSTISDLGKKVDSNGGGVNLLTNSQGPFRPTQKISSATVSDNYDVYNSDVYMVQGQTYTVSGQTNGTWSGTHDTEHMSDNCVLWLTDNSNVSQIISADTMPHTFTWPYPTKSYHLRVNAYHHGADNPIYAEKVKIERGSVATPYSPAPEDLATVTQVKQTADGIETTLKSAQGDIDQIKQTAKGTSEQLADVQGNVTNIQKDIDGLKQTTADNAGNIHTLQSDSKSLHDSMQDAQGDISTLKKTSTDVTSELKDHDGRISKAEQTASTLVNEFADQQGHLNRVEQTANGTQQTVANQQGQINNIKTDASGIHETLTGQGNQIANINVTLNGLSSKYEGVEKSGDELKNRLDNLSVGTRNLLHDTSDQYRTLTGSGRLEKSTASDIYTSVANYHSGDYFTYAATITNSSTKNAMLEVCLLDGNKNPLSASGEAYPVLIHSDSVAPWIGNIRESVTFRITSDTWFIRTYLVFDGGDAPAGSQISVKDERLVEGNMAGTWAPNPSDVADKITTNSTRIDQNKKEITLKADQSTVNNLSGEVSQNSAQLKVQAGQISSKVSSTDFKTLNDKVANMKIGGRNLLHNTSDQYKTLTGSGWLYATSASDMWTSTADYARGQQFVYSATINNISSVPVRLALYCYGANKTGQLHKTTGMTVSGGTIARCSVSITMDANTWFLCSDVETLDGQAPQFSIQVKDEKLEEGNVQTPWTPNPDDLITSISKNSTAIDQTNQQISLKADQTEVNNIKNMATQNSSRLDVMANEISSKVTSTDVNNIVNSKGYATTSTVQSLITQKASTINENIVKLDQTVKQGAENNVQLVRKSDFADGKGSWTVQGIASATNPAPPAELGQTGMNVLQTNTRDAYEDGIWYSVKPGEKFDVDFWCAPSPVYASSLGLVFVDKDKKNPSWQGVSTKLHGPGPWEHITGTITAPANASFAMPWFNMDKPADNTGNSAWLAKPSIRRQNATTVAAIQQITASIDGLQSTVANKADKSQITQLSDVIQLKVSSSDFNDLKDKTLWKSTDSVDLNSAVSQEKLFVRGGSNLPPGSYWWYVQVEPGYDSRIVQYAVSDRDNIHYSRQYDGKQWTAWSQGATESEITQLRDDINLRVKSGDLLSQINLTAHNTLIQSNKIYLDSSSTVFSGKAFIPSAAIVSLDADKINTGTLNTQMVSIGDDQTRLWARSNYLYLTGKDQGDAYNMRIGGDKIEFVTTEIPNDAPYLDGITPMYQIAYDGGGKSRLKIRSFNRLTGSNEFPIEMYDSINVAKDQLDFAANNQMKLQVVDGGVNVRPSLFFQNNSGNGTWAGFTRADNSNVVQFSTGDNNGENFRVDSGARFTQYLYINGNARAQQWLTNSALSKKMNIRKLDLQTALDKIRQDDQYLYEYKRNVAQGIHDPQASFIIDDVHDVAHYSVPREFIDQTGKYREPNVELAYLIAAFQAIDKQVQAQQAEIKALKEQLNNEQ